MMSHAPLDLPQALVMGCGHIGSVRNADLFDKVGCDVTHAECVNALRNKGTDDSGRISVSVHIPFCPMRCFTCDNVAQVVEEPSQIDRYLDSLELEVDMVAEHLGARRRLGQLHLGGGSPSNLNDRQLARLMAMLEHRFLIDETTETSLKINPKYTSAAQLSLLHGFGFRQVSLNMGDLDPCVQLAIGRVASYELVQDVVAAARDAGFDVVTADLMYGLPGQTRKSTETTISRLLQLAPDRLNYAAYTRKSPGAAHERAIDPLALPSLEDKQLLFDVIVQALCSSGYTWIGLDCFAKSKDTLCAAQQRKQLSKNWIGYTEQPTTCFIGLGTNGIMDLQHICAQNHSEIKPWSNAIAEGRLPIRSGVRLDSDDCRRRAALTQLVCNMELRDYAPLLGTQAGDQAWDRYARDGLLEITPERLTVTEQGRYLFQQILNRQMTMQMAPGT